MSGTAALGLMVLSPLGAGRSESPPPAYETAVCESTSWRRMLYPGVALNQSGQFSPNQRRCARSIPSQSADVVLGERQPLKGMQVNSAVEGRNNFDYEHVIGQPLAPLMIHNNSSQTPDCAREAGYEAILADLTKGVEQKNLKTFYGTEELQTIAAKLVQRQPRILEFLRAWGIPQRLHLDLYKLSLYDTVILCDDSGSMLKRGEKRVEALKDVLTFVTEAAALLDDDGISVRFLNNRDKGLDNVTDPAVIQALINTIVFDGFTPLGEVLEEDIIDPMCLSKLRRKKLTKPLLCIVITDGCPTDKSRSGDLTERLRNVLMKTYEETRKTSAIAFSFSQVGLSRDAQKFLDELDNDDRFGDMVDVTSNYEFETVEMMTASEDQCVITKAAWLSKLILGGIDRKYDSQDEVQHRVKRRKISRLFDVVSRFFSSIFD